MEYQLTAWAMFGLVGVGMISGFVLGMYVAVQRNMPDEW